MKQLIRNLVALTTLIFTVYSSYASDKTLLEICEASVTKYLVSPSTYTQINIVDETIAGTFEDYFKHSVIFYGPKEKKAIEAEGGEVSIHMVILEFDVQNFYGALVRKKDICIFAARGKNDEPTRDKIKFNGKSWTEYNNFISRHDKLRIYNR